jgi:cyclase
MLKKRIIPVLLIEDGYLVKTKQFKNPVYLGDPINAVKIFNEKEVDEIVILDISASKEGNKPNFELIGEIASECFMPMTYGGGITDIEDIKKLFSIGIEKVCINHQCLTNFSLVQEASRIFGAQSIVVSVDIKYNFFGKPLVFNHVNHETLSDPITYLCEAEKNGAGEIFLNFLDKDGVMQGYDISYLIKVTEKIKLPIIACGGAGSLDHIKDLFGKTKIPAAAAGSMFVFTGKHKAVLITYPEFSEVVDLLNYS